MDRQQRADLDRHITRDQPEPPEPEYGDGEHVDANGKSFAVGTRVKVGGWLDLPEAFGVVTEISDLDGDVNDEGRSVVIMPRVTVKFDAGDTEVYGTTGDLGMGMYADPVFTCEEIEVDEHDRA